MRFYIFALLIALAMAEEPTGDNNISPHGCAPHIHPSYTKAYFCLSDADGRASWICAPDDRDPIRFLRRATYSGNGIYCILKCLLQQLTVVDSITAHVSAQTLDDIIKRTDLTDSQKISASNLLKSCMADINTTIGNNPISPECQETNVAHCLGKALASNGCLINNNNQRILRPHGHGQEGGDGNLRIFVSLSDFLYLQKSVLKKY